MKVIRIIKTPPPLFDLLRVYSALMLVFYSWTLFVSFYKVPSWMFFLTAGQIASVYAYSFSVNFIESLLALFGLLLLDYTIFLPLNKKEEFLSRQIVVVLVLLISSISRLIFFKNILYDTERPVIREVVWWLLTFVVGMPLAAFVPRISRVRKALDVFLEKSLVFLYIYLPISMIAILTVAIRNILLL